MVVVVLECDIECEVQNSKGRTYRTCFDGQSNELGQESAGVSETSVRAMEVVDHAC